METTRNQTMTAPRKDGSEIRLNLTKLTLLILVLWVLYACGGTLLFIYIWEEANAYTLGYYIAHYWAAPPIWLKLAVICSAYMFLQSLLIYFLTGRKPKNLHFHFGWTFLGFLPKQPVPLKNFRLWSLLPSLLLGVLPAVHGFCIGNGYIYTCGLIGFILGTTDLLLCFKLRRFNDEDLIRLDKGLSRITIIRRNYGRKP